MLYQTTKKDRDKQKRFQTKISITFLLYINKHFQTSTGMFSRFIESEIKYTNNKQTKSFSKDQVPSLNN